MVALPNSLNALCKQLFRLPQSPKGSLKTQSNLIPKGQPHENHHH